MHLLSEYERHGFKLDELAPFLARHGIELDVPGSTGEIVKHQAFPEWKRVLSLSPYLTPHEMVCAFAGIDPHTPSYLSRDEDAELDRWRSVINRAMDSELKTAVVDIARDGEPISGILPADLAAWCASKGLNFPFPNNCRLPQSDAGLREALVNSDSERAQWKARAEALEAESGQRTRLQSEIDRLRVQLSAAADELAKMRDERGRLKADALAGKSRSSALKIIGGFAMIAYRFDIHKTPKLDSTVEMLNDLAKAGAAIDDQTLRSWLKAAAQVIEPPKKP